MLKFLPSLIVLQILLTLVVITVLQTDHELTAFVIAVYILVSGVAFAFWFRSISQLQSKDMIAALKEEHAQDREKIRVETEQQKVKVITDAQKQISKEVKRANAKANFKAGAVVAAAIGLGSLFIIGQMVTLGLITLTTAGGGLAGYLIRARQEKQKLKTIQTHSLPNSKPYSEKATIDN